MEEKENKSVFELSMLAQAGENTITEVFDGYEVTIKRTLSLGEVITFVESAVDMCLKDSDGSYMPEIRDFAILYGFVKFYTDIKIPEDASACYEQIYNNLDIIDGVQKLVNQRQYHMIIDAIDARIDFIVQANINSVSERVNNLISSFSSFEKLINDTANSVDNDRIKEMADAILNGKIDEEKLVKAVMKQE